MVRKLKTHEQKLLKKTDFMSWQVDQQGRQGEMLRKFHVTKREHYNQPPTNYNFSITCSFKTNNVSLSTE
ncbi:unnamed protein product [Caenorhabditis brenneri]